MVFLQYQRVFERKCNYSSSWNKATPLERRTTPIIAEVGATLGPSKTLPPEIRPFGAGHLDGYITTFWLIKFPFFVEEFHFDTHPPSHPMNFHDTSHKFSSSSSLKLSENHA